MYRMVHHRRTAWYTFFVAAGEARQRLLEAAIDHVTEHGMTDLTLRRLAEELGTSHRMLIHHFGSKEGLWVALVREVERRQVEAMSALVADPTVSFADAMRAWWRHVSDPSLWPSERLFFELYGHALHGTPATAGFLDGIVESWVAPAAVAAEAMGMSPADAHATARLGVAVTRGLLLDLLATQDRVEVDAAMEHWIASMVALLASPTASGRPRYPS
jgi:AcrR family transcriptional regulator